MFAPVDLILVTGASSGIGRAVATECIRAGATVLAQGRDGEKLAAARAASPAPERWHSLRRDFGDDLPGIPAWVRGLAAGHGKLWGLAHCAGSGRMDSLRNYDYAAVKAHFDLNFHAAMLLAQGFADRRVHRQGGGIVFMASAAGLFPEKGHLAYGAARAALMGAAGSMARELAPGLRVNCIAPGIVDTPMQQAAEALMGPSYRARMLEGYPLGFGEPCDIAHMATFLLSRRARWVTGQNFVLAGGRY